MKLNKNQVARIRKQTGFAPVPEEAAAEAGLTEHFGDQTFYADSEGLYVFEPVDAPSGTGDHVLAIRIAAVEPATDEAQGSDAVTIRAIQPKATSLTVDLAA